METGERMSTEMIDAFNKHTQWQSVDGRYTRECNKGLWSVEGPDMDTIDSEAMHYFIQYWEDGEYDDDPNEVMRRVMEKLNDKKD
jgi:hypothetical protein